MYEFQKVTSVAIGYHPAKK